MRIVRSAVLFLAFLNPACGHGDRTGDGTEYRTERSDSTDPETGIRRESVKVFLGGECILESGTHHYLRFGSTTTLHVFSWRGRHRASVAISGKESGSPHVSLHSFPGEIGVSFSDSNGDGIPDFVLLNEASSRIGMAFQYKAGAYVPFPQAEIGKANTEAGKFEDLLREIRRGGAEKPE